MLIIAKISSVAHSNLILSFKLNVHSLIYPPFFILDMQTSEMNVLLAVFCLVNILQLCHGVSSSGECYFNAKGKLDETIQRNKAQINTDL